MTICSICGASSFVGRKILSDALVDQWQLLPSERDYIDRQQGTSCETCGANLRSIALSDAIRNAVGTTRTLRDFVCTDAARAMSVLEINEAGSLNSTLRLLPGHQLAMYPDVDIHSLPYRNDLFDFVVHSDTLEHVAHPARALAECRRVLKPGGWLCFTVPTVVGRLTRSRVGLAKSFHDSRDTSDDFLVHSEFGADMWTVVLEAEFSAVTVNTVEFPAALALSARKT